MDERDPSSCLVSVSLVVFSLAKFSYSVEARSVGTGASLNFGLIGIQWLFSLGQNSWRSKSYDSLVTCGIRKAVFSSGFPGIDEAHKFCLPLKPGSVRTAARVAERPAQVIYSQSRGSQMLACTVGCFVERCLGERLLSWLPVCDSLFSWADNWRKSHQFSSNIVVAGLILRLKRKTSSATSVVYVLRIHSVRGFFFPQIFPKECEIKGRFFCWGAGLVLLTSQALTKSATKQELSC